MKIETSVSELPKSFTDEYSLGNVRIQLSYEFPFFVKRLHVKSHGPLVVDFGEAGYAGEGCVEVGDEHSCLHEFSLNVAYAPKANDEAIESMLTVEADVIE